MNRRADVLLATTTIAVALAMRLLSLHLSPLPFNTSAFVFVGRAEQIVADNALSFTGPAAPYPDEYLFDMLLAMLSEVTGVRSLYIVQVLIASLAVVPSLVVATYARRLTMDASRSARRAATAFAGIALAVEGLFLWRTLTISSEVYGIAFVVCIALTLHRALQTERRRWIALTAGLGVLMPIVHNGSTFVAGLVATTLTTLAIIQRFTIRRALGGAVGVIGFWLVAFGYYEFVELPNSGTISAAMGLFVGWAILVTALAAWLLGSSTRVQRGVPLAIFGAGVAVFVLNAVVPVFPGMPSTSPLLLALTLPLVALLIVGAIGLPSLAADNGLAMFAVALGPLAALGFALTGGRTPEYQALLTRSSTFLHPGILVAVALALVTITRRYRWAGRAVVGVVVLAIVVSATFPFMGVETVGYEFVTEPDEFSAAMFATEYVDDGWAADDHIANIATKYRPVQATSAPTTAWLQGTGPPPDCPVVARHSWTTSGAPDLPEPVTISAPAYQRWSVTGDIVYAGGDDDLTVLRWANGRCEGTSPHEAPV